MHNAVEIVGRPKMRDSPIGIFVEVEFVFFFDVFEVNCDEVIAVVGWVHVIEAESMQKLVDDCANLKATFA